MLLELCSIEAQGCLLHVIQKAEKANAAHHHNTIVFECQSRGQEALQELQHRGAYDGALICSACALACYDLFRHTCTLSCPKGQLNLHVRTLSSATRESDVRHMPSLATSASNAARCGGKAACAALASQPGSCPVSTAYLQVLVWNIGWCI